nr:deoxynucleotide monophosphate kinase [Sicyoidochytrium minutum DNA virus]
MQRVLLPYRPYSSFWIEQVWAIGEPESLLSRMQNRLIVAFTGPIGSGKDTMAERLIAHRGEKMKRFSFADPLKKMCSLMYDFDNDAYLNREKKEAIDPYWGISPRKAAQDVGTYVRDNFSEDHWVKLLNKRMARWDGDVVITDLRYDNEAAFLAGIGALVIRLDPGRRLLDCMPSGSAMTHASEMPISNDFVFAKVDTSVSPEESFGEVSKVIEDFEYQRSLPI